VRAPALNLQGASITDVIDQLASQLRINYILDPGVSGPVTVNTYGEMRDIDARTMLDMLLRARGAAMVQVGDVYRIVPMANVARMPISPRVDPQNIPGDEQMTLNLVFLKYASAGELSKLLLEYMGDGAKLTTYEPANLLIILDNNRNMRRTMELIAAFDNDSLASQRIRLFEVKNGSPSDVARELETVLRAMSLGSGNTSVKFQPLDRINMIIAMAPNPGVFKTVETWLEKLDVHVPITVGALDNYVYRVKYGEADVLASVIMQLYTGSLGSYSMGTGSRRLASSSRGVAGSSVGGSSGLSRVRSGSAARSQSAGAATAGGSAAGATLAGQPSASGAASTPFNDMSGYYMGASGMGGVWEEGMPRVVPNTTDNSLLIQATAADYARILKLLKEIDVPPRQILIEARIYEVTLTGAFAAGVSAALQKRGTSDLSGSGTLSKMSTRTMQGIAGSAGVTLTSGMLVGNTRELLAMLSASEETGNTKVISAPMIIATDSIPAYINVGQDVPTLTSQAVTGVQSEGNSLFANTISNRNSGVTLDITARTTDSGIVTLVIDQEVSSPQAASANAAIQSPSFLTRNISTQVTVQDGDTIAIGGIITESDTSSSAGVPYLHRIPVMGGLFGAKSKSKSRTELVVFLTPRVIYDTNAIADATEEVKSKLKRLTKLINE
jgi:general secretion pathway protein D